MALKRIANGFYEDEDGVTHVDIPELLEEFGYPDTPENRAVCAEVAAELLQQKWPGASVTVIEPGQIVAGPKRVQ